MHMYCVIFFLAQAYFAFVLVVSMTKLCQFVILLLCTFYHSVSNTKKGIDWTCKECKPTSRSCMTIGKGLCMHFRKFPLIHRIYETRSTVFVNLRCSTLQTFPTGKKEQNKETVYNMDEQICICVYKIISSEIRGLWIHGSLSLF